jgi:hypothetical protein
MTRQDGAYNLTRRRGKTATVTRLTGHSSDPETGAQTPTTVTTTVRWMSKDPTQYSRLFRAQQTQTDIGDTTFTMWLPDVSATFTTLTQEDYITYDGVKYEVVSATIEGNGFLVTARKFPQ